MNQHEIPDSTVVQMAFCFQLLKIEEIIKMTGLSRSTVNRLAYDPEDDFPSPIKVSSNTVRWLMSDMMSWLEAKQQGGQS